MRPEQLHGMGRRHIWERGNIPIRAMEKSETLQGFVNYVAKPVETACTSGYDMPGVKEKNRTRWELGVSVVHSIVTNTRSSKAIFCVIVIASATY